MPAFVIETNVPIGEIPDTFPEQLSAKLAEWVGKPEQYVCVHVKADQLMTFGGTRDRAAICSLSSIGKLGVEENKKYTEQLMQFIHEQLKIEPNRMYIFYKDVARADVGWNNKTFAS